MIMTTIFTTYGMLSSEDLKDYKEWAIESIEADDIEKTSITDDELYTAIAEDINVGFEDDYDYNLNKLIDHDIIAIASIGRWNGRVTGYKILSNNLHDILQSFGCDEYKVYTDKHNVKFKGYHHDGTNSMEFRVIKNYDNIDRLLTKLYNNEPISRGLLNYYTKSLKPYITEIFGC